MSFSRLACVAYPHLGFQGLWLADGSPYEGNVDRERFLRWVKRLNRGKGGVPRLHTITRIMLFRSWFDGEVEYEVRPAFGSVELVKGLAGYIERLHSLGVEWVILGADQGHLGNRRPSTRNSEIDMGWVRRLYRGMPRELKVIACPMNEPTSKTFFTGQYSAACDLVRAVRPGTPTLANVYPGDTLRDDLAPYWATRADLFTVPHPGGRGDVFDGDHIVQRGVAGAVASMEQHVERTGFSGPMLAIAKLKGNHGGGSLPGSSRFVEDKRLEGFMARYVGG